MFARSAYLALTVTLALGGCAQPANQAAAPVAVDSAVVRAAVADLWQRWIAADTAGNIPELVDMVADSVRIDLRGMPPMVGREAWRAAIEAIYQATKYTSMTAEPDMTIAISNELAYQNGSFTEGSTAGGKSVMDYGRYAAAIRKLPDGRWRWVYVMAFSDSTVPVK